MLGSLAEFTRGGCDKNRSSPETVAQQRTLPSRLLREAAARERLLDGGLAKVLQIELPRAFRIILLVRSQAASSFALPRSCRKLQLAEPSSEQLEQP